MKFLCDRCKTRYSIGDDRVRGKILKIRCKNCANVITVREGMSDADAAEPGPRRSAKPTTLAPPVTMSTHIPTVSASSGHANPAPNGPSSSAAAVSSRPPPALEEEWYVSNDGDQEGPFSLAEAQRWIAAKSLEADLHCWSEGFDDWLPVDKVSHFRGLRKKPAPSPGPPGPPPLPRSNGAARLGTQTAGSPVHREVEEEPKPLFAATMASIEKSAAAAAAAPKAIRPSATPPTGEPKYPAAAVTPPPHASRANGAGTGPAKIPAPASAPVVAPRSQTAPGIGGTFDVGGDPATQIEAAAWPEASPAVEPVVPRVPSGRPPDPFAKALGTDTAAVNALTGEVPTGDARARAAAPAPRLANAPITEDSDHDDEDDSLSIGEVSRVVKLADLARPAPKKVDPAAASSRRTGAVAKINATGAIARVNATGAIARVDATGAVARIGGTAQVMRIDDPALLANATGAELGQPVVGDPAAVPAQVAASHRRHMIILLGAATVLLAGVIIAVVVFGQGGSDPQGGRLGANDTIDTTRPDDPLRKAGLEPGPGSGSNTPQNPFFPRPNRPRPPPNLGSNAGTGSGSSKDPTDLPTGDSLRSDEIEEVAKKYSTGTQRCYMRSQKGQDAILIGDVKKIQVTLNIGKDGSVSDVTLSSHADDNLGKCLNTSIRGWRFRPSPGGLFKISLQFVAN